MTKIFKSFHCIYAPMADFLRIIVSDSFFTTYSRVATDSSILACEFSVVSINLSNSSLMTRSF